MSLVKNAIYLAWSDTKARYKASVIGPFWLTLSTVLGVLCLGLVWGHLLKQDMNKFIPQLTVGLIVWQLVAGVLTDAPSMFARNGSMIRNVVIPSWFFAVRALSKHIINLFHNFVVIIGVVIYYEVPLTTHTWLVLPGLILVILNLYWIIHGIGLVGARFRDVEMLVTSVVPLLFFISPVIYRAESLPSSLNLVWLNPFSYMIEAIRTPILGGAPPTQTWVILVSIWVVGGGLTWYYNRTQGKNLAFWV
jgi:ABC-type polysaccharide/polyol phosphate export permease